MLNAALMTEEKIPSCWAGPRDGLPGRAAAQCGRKSSDWAGLYGGAHMGLGRGPTSSPSGLRLPNSVSHDIAKYGRVEGRTMTWLRHVPAEFEAVLTADCNSIDT